MALDIWNDFIRNLTPYLSENQDKILFVLQRAYNNTSRDFRCCKAKEIFNEYIKLLQCQPDRLYVILTNLKTKLNNYQHYQAPKEKKEPKVDKVSCSECVVQLEQCSFQTKQPHTITSELVSNNFSCETLQGSSKNHENITQPPETISKVHSSSFSENVNFDGAINSAPSSLISSRTLTTHPENRERAEHTTDLSKIRCLERSLKCISGRIAELESQELSLDDLDSESSSYLQLDALKRRHISLWKQVCRLRKIPLASGRILRRRLTYKGSQYAEVNRRVEDLINNLQSFPDYLDIQRIVEDVNSMKSLNLNCLAMGQIAREVFTDVGHLLKERRQRDYLSDLSCPLTDVTETIEEDPALLDSGLRRKLRENQRLSDRNLANVFRKYSRLQCEREHQAYCLRRCTEVATADRPAEEQPSVEEDDRSASLSSEGSESSTTSGADDVIIITTESEADEEMCAPKEGEPQSEETPSAPKETAMERPVEVINLNSDEEEDEEEVTIVSELRNCQSERAAYSVGSPHFMASGGGGGGPNGVQVSQSGERFLRLSRDSRGEPMITATQVIRQEMTYPLRNAFWASNQSSGEAFFPNKAPTNHYF